MVFVVLVFWGFFWSNSFNRLSREPEPKAVKQIASSLTDEGPGVLLHGVASPVQQACSPPAAAPGSEEQHGF